MQHTLLGLLDGIPHVKQQLVLCSPSMLHGCNAGRGLGQLGILGSQCIPGGCQLPLQMIRLQLSQCAVIYVESLRSISTWIEPQLSEYR